MSVHSIDMYRTHLRKMTSIFLSDLAIVYTIRFFMKGEAESVPQNWNDLSAWKVYSGCNTWYNETQFSKLLIRLEIESEPVTNWQAAELHLTKTTKK